MAYKKLKQILLCGALSAALATAPVFASDGVSSAASDAVTTADTSEPAAESSVSTPKAQLQIQTRKARKARQKTPRTNRALLLTA